MNQNENDTSGGKVLHCLAERANAQNCFKEKKNAGHDSEALFRWPDGDKD